MAKQDSKEELDPVVKGILVFMGVKMASDALGSKKSRREAEDAASQALGAAIMMIILVAVVTVVAFLYKQYFKLVYHFPWAMTVVVAVTWILLFYIPLDPAYFVGASALALGAMPPLFMNYFSTPLLEHRLVIIGTLILCSLLSTPVVQYLLPNRIGAQLLLARESSESYRAAASNGWGRDWPMFDDMYADPSKTVSSSLPRELELLLEQPCNKPLRKARCVRSLNYAYAVRATHLYKSLNFNRCLSSETKNDSCAIFAELSHESGDSDGTGFKLAKEACEAGEPRSCEFVKLRTAELEKEKQAKLQLQAAAAAISLVEPQPASVATTIETEIPTVANEIEDSPSSEDAIIADASATQSPPEPRILTREVASQTTPDASAKPSFNCEKASNESERAICSSASLSQLDLSLSRIYGDAARTIKAKKPDCLASLKNTQNKWIRNRNQCRGDADCLTEQMNGRASALRQPTSLCF